MTDAPDTRAQASAGTLCLDFKLFATWELSLTAIRLLALDHVFDDVAAPVFYGGLVVMFAAFVFTAINHRRHHNWHWPGLDQDSVQRTLFVAAGFVIFCLVARSGMPPFTRAGTPEIFFVFSLFAFALLYSMNIVQWSREQFDECCGEAKAKAADDDEPTWMRLVRGAYLTALPLVVLEGVAAVVVDIRVKENATHIRTASHIILLNDHGRHYWLTPEQWQLFHGLMQPLNYTIPAMILGGLFLRHVLNVKLFPFLDGIGALLSPADSE